MRPGPGRPKKSVALRRFEHEPTRANRLAVIHERQMVRKRYERSLDRAFGTAPDADVEVDP